MVSKEQLKRLVHRVGLAQLDKLLLILVTDDVEPKLPKEIKKIANDVGLRAARGWNISKALGRSKGLAISVPGGWEVSANGLLHLRDRGLVGDVQISQPATNLRTLLPKIINPRTREFMTEAVTCYEATGYRSSTVLSWIGAVALLYEHVFSKKLGEFNAEFLKRQPKQKPIVVTDDFTEIKESDFLDILQAISIIGKSVKDELKQRLQLRNGCGHPNSLTIGQLVAAAHLESLINNVYTVF